MPPRRAVDRLPEDVRDELNAQLIQRGFAGYQDLSTWLKSLGYDISKSAVHRYGEDFDKELAALKLSTDQARAMVSASPDEEGSMSDALIRLTQRKLFTVLRATNNDAEAKGPDLPKMARAVADLARTTVNLRRFQSETREKIAADLKALEKEGFDKDTLAAVNSRISVYLPANGR